MENNKKPTYSIQSFHFENFKGIKKTEMTNLPEGAPWIFLTGENGFGKTSVLQAITTSLTITFNIRSYNHELSITERTSLKTSLNDGRNFSFRLNYKRSFRGFFKELACYGSSRLNTHPEMNSEKIKQSNIDNLFNTDTYLENIEYQLTRWFAKKSDKEFNEKYQKTKQLLIDILQIKDIKIDFRTDKVTYIEQDNEGEAYEPLPLNQLASGYRSLIAMVGDIILKLFRTQPEILDPKELEGIVIIDELDLHFHPKWQKRLPQILTKHFPKIQFIASTHSPIPFLGAPKGSVFLTVNRSKEAGITIERMKHLEDEIRTLTPNLLLNSPIFGYADLFSSRFKANQDIHTEDTFTEIEFNQQMEESFLKELPTDKKNQLRALLKKK